MKYFLSIFLCAVYSSTICAQNIGIGTTMPLAPLHIKNDNEALRVQGTTPFVSFYDNNGILKGFIQQYNNNFFLGTPSSNPNGIMQLYLNNTPVMTVLPSGKVGIGTATPADKLTLLTPINNNGWSHIGQVNGADSIIVSEGIGGVSASMGTATNHAFRLNAGGQGRISIYPAGQVVVGDNNSGSFGKFSVQTTNNTYGISHLGENGNILATNMGGTSAGIGTFSHTNMRIFSNGVSCIFVAEATGNVGIGTDNPTYKLAVNGTIRAKEVIVETGWADYVFSKNYALRPLKDVEKFIQLNKHLPNIPAASKIEKNGLAVAETQRKMMEKIEELTLYIIDLNKKIEVLEKRAL